jgi:hypothetical protein
LTWRLALASVAFLAASTLLRAVGGIAQVSPAQTTLEQEMRACRAGKAALASMMASVFHDFDAAQDPAPLEILVAIDGRSRALLRDRPSYRPCQRDRELIYDKRWERMGVMTDAGTTWCTRVGSSSHITAGSWSNQEQQAKGGALGYYQRLLRLAPGDERVRTLLEEPRKGIVRAWRFCAD